MVHQIFSVLLMVFAIAVCSPFHAVAQLGSSGHRTSWDAPNLQGVWDFRSLTPMERPTDLATNETFTEEQAVEF